MSLVVNLRHLEAHNIRLKGQVPVAELGIASLDEVCLLYTSDAADE